MLPPTALLPDQAPEAEQLVGELVVLQAKVTEEPLATVIGPSLLLAVKLTVGTLATLTVTESGLLLPALLLH